MRKGGRWQRGWQGWKNHFGSCFQEGGFLSLLLRQKKVSAILLVTAEMGETLRGRQLPQHTPYILTLHLCHHWFNT